MGISGKMLSICAISGAVLAAAGCGSSSPSSSPSSSAGGTGAAAPTAAQLQSSMKQSVQRASSVHVAGHGTSNGMPVTIDMNLTRSGGLSGTVTENGAPFQIVSTGGKVYAKVTKDFLKQEKAPAAACSLVCGKWLQLTSAQGKQLTQVSGGLNLKNLAGELGQAPKLTKSGTTTVAGQPAYVLKDSKGTKVAVQTASSHYPLELTSAGAAKQVLTFSKWNSAPKPVAPPKSQTVNLSQLGQQ
jgi:hypothetical protein